MPSSRFDGIHPQETGENNWRSRVWEIELGRWGFQETIHHLRLIHLPHCYQQKNNQVWSCIKYSFAFFNLVCIETWLLVLGNDLMYTTAGVFIAEDRLISIIYGLVGELSPWALFSDCTSDLKSFVIDLFWKHFWIILLKSIILMKLK